tara:strand:- start:746 stop:1813 length:1068 start_codon:yes stop_codon:yes gene_type:complete
MNKEKISRYIVQKDVTIIEGMKIIDSNDTKILFIINELKELAGVVTDGDIRRAILKGKSLEKPIFNVCNKNPIQHNQDYSINNIKNIMIDKGIQAVPIIDDSRNIVDILFRDILFSNQVEGKKTPIKIPVLVMAGGKGTRLDPITRILPKPLIPMGDHSLLELVLKKFEVHDVSKFYISINHKGGMVKAYLDEINHDYNIKYLEETKPLGTVGVLSFLKGQIDNSLIMINCDTIIIADYSKIIDFHNSNNSDITIVGSMKNHSIPYGICEIEDGGKLIKIIEKPDYTYLVSTGMYIIKNTSINLIPDNKFYDITDLIHRVKKKGGIVSVYPISEKSWMDTGDWEQYNKTKKQLNF